MFEVNGTLVIFVLSFLAFMFLLNQIMLKPVGRVIEQRAERIEGDLQAAKAARHQADELVEKYEHDLRRIRSEAQAVINKSVEEANVDRSAHLSKLMKEAHRKLEEARAELAAERPTLIDALVTQERELVEMITRRVADDESVKVSVDTSQIKRQLEEG